MVWSFSVEQMLDQDGQVTGTWRMVARNGKRGPISMCECNHKKMQGARDCETARRRAKRLGHGKSAWDNDT